MGTNTPRRTFISDLSISGLGEVLLRGWVYRLRVLGKTSFLVLRDCSGEAQCVAATADLKHQKLTVEDAVEIQGIVRAEDRSWQVYLIYRVGIRAKPKAESGMNPNGIPG